MSQRDFDRAKRAAENGLPYDPPTKPFLLELIEGHSEKQIEDIQDYKDGWKAGKTGS